MKIRLNIRQKIFFSVLSVSTILYVVAVGYIVNSARKELLNDAFLNAKNTTKLAAEKIEKDFERDLAVTRTLAQAFSIYQELPTNEWQSIFKKMYKPVLEGNKHIYSIWDSWEFYGYVPNYSKDYGRYCVTLWRENDEIKELTEERSLTGDPDKYGDSKRAIRRVYGNLTAIRLALKQKAS